MKPAAVSMLALCLAAQPCAAGSLEAPMAGSGQAAATSGSDFDDGRAEGANGAVTFGRMLDLEGTPIRLTGPRRGPGGFARAGAAWTGPASMPTGSPVRALGLTSTFGSRWHPVLGGERFHAGIDLAAPAGTAVAATANGLVQAAGWCGGYGLCVAIEHGGGYLTVYGHLSKIDVGVGQTVGAGQTIGQVGSTGLSTGPHLHYEVRYRDRPVNPAKFL
ncbi:MAG: M23 family metallopeptidase [Sphingomonadaceae bacterium]